MWLLDTKTAILHKFRRPEDAPGGYAILSHVWGKEEEEDSFQKVQDAAKRFKDIATPTRHISSAPSTHSSPRTTESGDLGVQQQGATEEQGDPLCETLQDSLGNDSNTARTRPEAQAQATSPRDLVSPKIRNFLIQAETEGYEWAWSDTCCIDKTSSTELTEAINSMFQYYSLSEVCYAYLVDVPQNTSPDSISKFRTSKWHQRG